ncbi:MAG TPA: TatD family hydrolase [Candidatus Aphodomonas merdavium]|nr:TatD family hydrolase [Candidatus Aphodomonas merdavium]
MLFDTHCHLYAQEFDADREEILDEMQAQGFMPCVLAAEDMPTSQACRRMAAGRPWLYFAAGVHPHNASGYSDAVHAELLAMMGEEKCVAWGEIGLDYHYDFSPRDVQKEAFVCQLDAACMLKKPIVLHIREAHDDALAILRARRGRLPSGVVHCFSGSPQQAQEYIGLGFYLGFDGPVTFKNAPRLQACARLCPAERLLVETDSPFLSPEPVRGRRNDPRNTLYIARKLAEIRQEPLEAVCAQTLANGLRLFGIALPKECD